MATATNTGTAARHVAVAPFAAALVLPVAALTAVLHAVAAVAGPAYWFDEVYMLAIGRHHLDWGSVDQPPLTTALAAAMDAVAPGSVVALRLPAILATATAVVIAGLIARELGGDRRAQVLTAVAQATAVWPSLAGHWLTPYTLEPAQWSLILWLSMRWVRVRDDRLLLLLGVVIGAAALTKFQVLLLVAVLLTAVAVFGPRELLRRPLLWVGVVVAAGLAAPTLLWQHAHGWPQLEMTAVVAGEADALYGGRPGIAIQIVAFAGLAGAVLVLFGLWRLLRARELRPYRFIGVTFAVLFVVFVVAQGRPYYLCGLYAPLAAAGALGLQRVRESHPARTRRWPRWAGYSLTTAVAVTMLVVSCAMTRSDVGERIAADTADAYDALPTEQRDRTALFGASYIIAAYLDGYSARFGLPLAHSTNRSYGYFAPPSDTFDTVLYVGPDDRELRPYFHASRVVGTVGDDMRVHLLTGLRRPWHTIWPELRSLTVS
ncbi:ArnT family glycosyltransferase [Mycolicibacterium arseniciresistens]|uniref:Glycosyltransferase family 39 protein n=1 Tax=Mycolicibacterium arseniciresistens TaxID=3062257 RepID=A0ABT8UEH0_9MYCO|nr:glycosyltransferase family 39 protein [Mycolicibacterium arseniciresistens]MDO3636187.1 glycosyltransferase family 39 protein [Mycolicibacterium arseniciresistens]